MDRIESSVKYELVTHTFGCKVNFYDSGLIQKNLKSQMGLPTSSGLPQVHVLNTCAVTAEATQQAVRLIRKIRSRQPFATVVVTGCAAQVDTAVFEKLSAANLVVANSHKGMLPQILDQYFKGIQNQKVFKSNIFKKEDLEVGGGDLASHTRSFLKIQDGCNSFCSFCIIPYARGKSRSIPIKLLTEKIQQLANEAEVKEVVLTGVHIGDYLDESEVMPRRLEDLVESILQKTNIQRLRLSSLEPIELSDRILDLFSDARLCPHFHLSIQSADSQVLKEMKRHYDESAVRKALEEISLRLPKAFVGMDVIAGFPTETDEQFENTYRVLAESPWTRLHVFPYSERSGTRAATLPQVSWQQRKHRAARLRELSLHRWQGEALKQIGQQKQALVLKKPTERLQAITRDYWNIIFAKEENDLVQKNRNQEKLVRIDEVVANEQEVLLKASYVIS